MRLKVDRIVPITLLVTALFGLAAFVGAEQPQVKLKIEDVMTPNELNDSGIASLTSSQREVLDVWLNRYTQTVIKVVGNQGNDPPAPTVKATGRSDCSPAVESTIAGDFNGWEGETLFKLDNGQIWEQADSDYNYFYSYRPDVTIYLTSSGCTMKVEDEDETITVRKIK
jgi:hypothetical protein